jgi:hypothetical protein
VFVTESGTPVTTAWFLRMIQRTDKAAQLSFPIHPHMLRHSTDYKLANQGEDTRSFAHYLGHRNLQSTAGAVRQSKDRRSRAYSPTSKSATSTSGPLGMVASGHADQAPPKPAGIIVLRQNDRHAVMNVRNELIGIGSDDCASCGCRAAPPGSVIHFSCMRFR